MEFLLDKALLQLTTQGEEDNNHQIAALADMFGSLPLHIISNIQNKKKSKIVQKVLLANIKAIRVTDVTGRTPLDIFFTSWQRHLETIGMRHNFCFNEFNPCEHTDLFETDEDWDDMKNTFLLLFKAYAYGTTSITKKEVPYFPLHKALSMKCIPSIFILFLIDMLPNEHEKIDEGNFPLNIALVLNHYKGNEETEYIW